jgi:hypothetical protein
MKIWSSQQKPREMQTCRADSLLYREIFNHEDAVMLSVMGFALRVDMKEIK